MNEIYNRSHDRDIVRRALGYFRAARNFRADFRGLVVAVPSCARKPLSLVALDKGDANNLE